jgi:hypothetical protein
LLTAQGWEVLRIPYEPPLSKRALKEIIETIKKFTSLNDE